MNETCVNLHVPVEWSTTTKPLKYDTFVILNTQRITANERKVYATRGNLFCCAAVFLLNPFMSFQEFFCWLIPRKTLFFYILLASRRYILGSWGADVGTTCSLVLFLLLPDYKKTAQCLSVVLFFRWQNFSLKILFV